MNTKKSNTLKAQPKSNDYVTWALTEVKGWPEWKKAFASDVYSVSIKRFESKVLMKKQK